MILCRICWRSYCPVHHLKHGFCKIPINNSVPFFTGQRSDPFPLTSESVHLKLPLCCAPDCTSIAINQCANFEYSTEDKCNMYFCKSHYEHVHHLCDYPGCNANADKCFDRPFGCDNIRCDYHYRMTE